MILRSFSFSPSEVDISLYHSIWTEVQGLRWYFYKFAGLNAEEAMSKTCFHTLTHFDPSKGSLSAYVKKLAREITKENSRLIYVDFLEQTVSDDDDMSEVTKQASATTVKDFSDEVIDGMEMAEDRRPEVINIALEFMDKFLSLVDALQRRDTSTKYFPDIFINACMRVATKCNNFNQLCLEIADEYGEDFRWFLGLEKRSENWREPDFMMIRTSLSKRLKLCYPFSDVPVEDADVDAFIVQGKLGDGSARKKIIKVSYYDAWEMMCDMIDSPVTNEMKFVIGNSYVIRTLAGSCSGLNTDLYTMYDLVRCEILTNVLIDTGGRILNIGSENFYLVCNGNMDKDGMVRQVKGKNIVLEYSDITDSIL